MISFIWPIVLMVIINLIFIFNFSLKKKKMFYLINKKKEKETNYLICSFIRFYNYGV
jgi:hypothetical protein